MPEITYEIIKAMGDSDDVRFKKDGVPTRGYGYKPKAEGKDYVGLIRCPNCEMENYAMAVIHGVCAWCAWGVAQIGLTQYTHGEI